jgi:hypothetical protein
MNVVGFLNAAQCTSSVTERALFSENFVILECARFQADSMERKTRSSKAIAAPAPPPSAAKVS